MAYQYRRAITIDHVKVPNTDQTDFPLAFVGTYAGGGSGLDLRTVANGGKVENASGYDIAFFADLALTVPLDFERAQWSATTGAAEFHIRVPTLATATDTVIYIAYGDSGISTYQGDVHGTWKAAYKGVWHLADGTTLGGSDSTSNANNGTVTGAVAGAGQLGGAADFDGVDDIIDAGSGASLDDIGGVDGPRSVSAWIYPRSGGEGGIIFYKIVSGGGWQFNVPASASIRFIAGTLTTNVESISAASSVPFNTWRHVVATWAGTAGTNTAKLYVDGVETGSYQTQTAGGISPVSDAVQNVYIGNRADTARTFDGLIDELRVASGVLSPDWIATEYNNQSSPSTFYRIGDELGYPTYVLLHNGSGFVARPLKLHTGAGFEDAHEKVLVSSSWVDL